MRYGYDELLADIYKGSYNCFSIGKSHMGREILSLKLGKGSTPVLVVGAHHGREYISSWFIMRELEHLEIYDNITLYAVPMLNPDGVEISLTADPAWKANARGVDLNRNYPCLFFQKISEASAGREGFKGFYPASENEVIALMDFTQKINPYVALTFHAKGEEIYYADDNSTYLEKESLKYAELLSGYTGYKIMDISTDRARYGAGFENWMRAKIKQPCLLIELSPYDNSPLPYLPNCFSSMTAPAKGMMQVFLQFVSKKVSEL